MITRHNGARDKNYKEVVNGKRQKTDGKGELRKKSMKKQKREKKREKPSFLGYISQDEDGEDKDKGEENRNSQMTDPEVTNPENRSHKKMDKISSDGGSVEIKSESDNRSQEENSNNDEEMGEEELM